MTASVASRLEISPARIAVAVRAESHAQISVPEVTISSHCQTGGIASRFKGNHVPEKIEPPHQLTNV
jgi:hypothetical protein